MSIPYRSGDELDDIGQGEAAFWRCNERDGTRSSWWLMGYDKAAREAALLLQGETYLIKAGRTVREALMQGQAAIRSLIPVKCTPGQRRTAELAIHLMDEALRSLEKPSAKPSTQSPTPSGVGSSRSLPDRGARGGSGTSDGGAT